MSEHEVADLKGYINEENNKNKHKITCTKCSCVILRQSDGCFSETEIELPVMKTNAELKKQIADGQCKSNQIEVEKLKDCWCIDDIYTFENVGVSNTVDGLKYLICADCEYGPIGVHFLENKKSYLAINRVKHRTEDGQEVV